MTGSTGAPIDHNDYDTIRDNVATLLGIGAGSRGYGQSVYSADVVLGNTITKAQWDAVRYDLVTILYHQTGVLPSLVTVNVGDPIRYGPGNPNIDYATAFDSAETNRFVLANSQSMISTAAEQTYSSNWHIQARATLTVTFDNANNARYFFNSGGKIRFTSSHVGGDNTPQNVSWSNLLSAVGTQGFGADSPAVNFYNLTNSYQTFYTFNSTLYYGGNSFTLEAKSDVSNNSSGTATVLTFRITWADTFVDRKFPPLQPDNVNGNLSILVEELRAVGQTFPGGGAGSFAIVPPIYSISSISAS